MSEVVVFGGNGFIGHHLVEALVQKGHRVRVASRTSSPVSPAGENPQTVRADVSDPASVHAAIAGAEFVFHLASGGGKSWAEFERDFVRGAWNVALCCLGDGVKRLLYTSSSAALFLGGGGVLREEDGVDPRPEVRGDYSRGKVEAERVLRGLHQTAGLPVVILRPAVVVGEGGLLGHSALGSWVSPTRCLGRGSGTTPLPFVLVQDVVQALLASMEAPRIEGMTFNLAGDVRPSAQEYLGEMARRTRRDFRFRPKSLAAHYALDLGKWALKRLGGRKDGQFPSWHSLQSRTMSRWIDNRAAKRHLGWLPVNDREWFFTHAIGPFVDPIPPGDLRDAVA